MFSWAATGSAFLRTLTILPGWDAGEDGRLHETRVLVKASLA